MRWSDPVHLDAYLLRRPLKGVRKPQYLCRRLRTLRRVQVNGGPNIARSEPTIRDCAGTRKHVSARGSGFCGPNRLRALIFTGRLYETETKDYQCDRVADCKVVRFVFHKKP